MRQLAIWMWLVAAPATWAAASLEFVGTAYRADQAFPEFTPLWSESWALKAGQVESPLGRTNGPLGAYVQAWVQNRSAAPLTVSDVKLEGVSLTAAVAFGHGKTAGLVPASIRFATLADAERERLMAAGEPVWWRVEPPVVAPGGFAEVTVRLRRQTKVAALALELAGEQAGWKTRVPVRESPGFAGLSFSRGLDMIYAYVGQGRVAGRAPVKVLVDGQDLTAQTTMGADAAVGVTPLVVRLNGPLAKGSFHCFRAVLQDGSQANAAVHVWSDELVYGMWGYVKEGKTEQERVDYYLGDLRRHNVNAVMESYGGEVAAYLSGESGAVHSRQVGIRAMRNRPGNVADPLYYFLTDEPDAHDYAVKALETNQRLGALGQDLVRRSRQFREEEPTTPHLLNLDNTYKPENWYTYAQLADVCCADPYFQEQQRIVWNERPAWAPWFLKPTYVLGAATICQSACAPKPLHIILNSVRHDIKAGPFRFATPEEKTVELFYALGGGAKGFSYWWYTPYGEFHGCGAKDEAAVALWRQIGLLGAQVRTAGPLLTRSCPAAVPVKAPGLLWTRTLLAGMDSVVLLAVNENVIGDRQGSVVLPLAKATVSLTRPKWLEVADGFEITPSGVRMMNWKQEGDQVVVDFGPTEVARMVVLTADRDLHRQLDRLYQAKFAQTVAGLLPKTAGVESQGPNAR